jgi:hypothetical protein
VQNSLSKGIADAVSGLPSLAEGGRRVHIPLFKPSFREKIATHCLLYMSNYEYVHIYIYLFIYLFGGSPSKIIRRHKQQRKETQRRKGTITRKNKHIAFIFDSTFIDTYMHPCTLRLLCFFVDAIDMRLIFPV